MGRKEDILYATLKLASENGLRAVSMSQIAEKVGIRAPSLYNHFKSKDEILKAMYGFFREKAQRNRSFDLSDMNDATSKSLEQLLTESLVAYLEIISDSNMLLFFRVLYSERSIDPKAAEIVLEETNRMIRSTKSLFYALTVHGKMKMEGVDTAATVFALTVHSLIDYRMDAITAGITDSFGEDGSPCTKALTDFVHWFSLQVGGDCHEQKTH